METLKLLFSDSDWDFKMYVLNLKARILFGELHVQFLNATISIIENQEFWLTGSFLCAMFFFASKEDKNNVEFG